MIFEDCVRLKNGAVIGSRGMRSERDDEGRLKVWDHEYGCAIADSAVIGPNCTVQRGTWRHTFIGARTQIGAQVNIGHNAYIGTDGFICAGALIAGSCTIGDRVTIWQGAMIGHRTIVGDDVEIGMGAVVLPDKNLPPHSRWVGNPARRIT